MTGIAMTTRRTIQHANAGAIVVVMLGFVISGGVFAADVESQAAESGYGITQNLGAEVPLELKFRDENGKRVTLGDYFEADRPVVFNMVYFQCPNLCQRELNEVRQLVEAFQWKPGKKYQIVTVSFLSNEGPALAKAKKASYMKELGKRGVTGIEDGWAFLTGEDAEIKALTEALGFEYQFNRAENMWAHGAALIIATPEGKISRYLAGSRATRMKYNTKTVRTALVEASNGAIAETLADRFVYACGAWDPDAGKYVIVAWKIMLIGLGITTTILIAVLVYFWRRENKRKRNDAISHAQVQPA